MNTSSSSIVQSDTVIVDTDSTQIKDALPAGTRLQNYILQRAIGQGGFGITYLATEKLTGRRVVIKENYPKDYKKNYVERSSEDGLTVVPNPNYKEFYDWSKKSFVKEAVTLIDLPYNPHIVRVLSVLEENNTAYIVMPLIEGRDMATCYQGGATMPESELRIFLTCMLGALAHLHAHNIIHRDIKPANILITPKGKPVLIDFGAARPDNTGKTATQVGTGGYAPPEQISEKLYDKHPKPHTDLYALGATCYRLITGYEPDYSYEQLEQDSSAMGSYSPELLRSIDKAREQKPEHRWQSAQEWLAEITTNNKKDTPGVVPTEPPRRSRSNVALILLILVLALGIPGGYVLYQHAQEIGAQRLLVQQEAEQKAQEEAERKAREEAERKVREEAERKAREEAERKAREEAERKAREEAERKAREEAERKAREEAERKAREEAERKAREEAERKAREEAERKVREEAERKAKEEAERKAREEAERKAREEAKRLLSRKGISESEYSSRIISAAEKGDKELLARLIAAGADVNAADKDGWTPLYRAADEGHAGCVKLLLAAPGIDVNKATKYGWTPLCRAASVGHSECVKLLLAAPGIDVNLANMWGETPLNRAADWGNSECVELLLAAPGIDVNAADMDGNTPLFMAAWYGRSECVRLLLAAPGIDVNLANKDGWTPLYQAAWKGHSACVKLLLAAPGIDVNMADKDGWTPLNRAAIDGHSECVKLLLAAPGIDVNKEDKDGNTPLEAAEANGKTECARLIRAAGGRK